jgi:hypothetical protein
MRKERISFYSLNLETPITPGLLGKNSVLALKSIWQGFQQSIPLDRAIELFTRHAKHQDSDGSTSSFGNVKH